MPSKKYKPLDLTGIKTRSLSRRKSKVTRSQFSKPWQPGAPLKAFLKTLPDILAARDIKDVIRALATAHRQKRNIIFGMGAHVVKVGLNPVVIDLIRRKIVTAVALNGAGMIHDLEIALAGHTSEDVSAALANGSFGMTKESCAFLNEAIAKTAGKETGLGETVGRAVMDHRLPFRSQSIMAASVRYNIPLTIHVAFGTDILHMHPEFDPQLTGAATHRDFRLFAAVVAALEKGVYLNIGSAVILPEIFLKAVTLARNLGHPLEKFTTVNLDFIRHYRPQTNVVDRPTARGGRGFNLVGHHEIMLPLIAAGVIEQLGK